MENVSELIKGLSEKLDIQSREIKTLKTSLENKPQWKQKGDSWKDNSHRKPRFQMNNVNYHRDNDRGGYYKEYTVKEKIYYPEGGHVVDRENHVSWNRGSWGAAEDYSFSGNYRPRRYGQEYQGQARREYTDSKYPTKNFSPKPKSVKETEVKLRQNHLPFVIDKADQSRKCNACWKDILKEDLIILHKEIKIYYNPKQGWEKPIYAKDPTTHFYHFNKCCLKRRGFEDSYLSLCYVEVFEIMSKNDLEKIHDLGFRRPIKVREKETKNKGGILDVNDTEVTSGDGKKDESESLEIDDSDKKSPSVNITKDGETSISSGSPKVILPECLDRHKCENDLHESEFDFCN